MEDKDRESQYHKRLREQRLKEIRFNRAVLAAILGITLVAGGAGIIFGIGHLLDKDDSVAASERPSSTVISAEPDITVKTSISSASDISTESTIDEASKSDTLAKSDESAEKESKKAEDKEDISNSIKEVSTSKANKYFKGSVFIGDSRTQGLQINSGVTSADYLAGRGLNVKTIYTEKVIRNKQTVLEALKDKSYKKVYICYGLNELGWSYTDVFINDYGKLIDDIAELQPDAEIVVESILPVTKKKSKSDKIFNLKNIKKFNKLIKQMCKEKDVKYINLAPAVQTSAGYLPAEATNDGIHMNKEYCRRVMNYIINKKY